MCLLDGFPVCPNTNAVDGTEAACACTDRSEIVIAGVLHAETTDAFWDPVYAAAQTAGQDMGVDLQLDRWEPESDKELIHNKMAGRIESYCKQGVDGIFVTIPSDTVIPAIQTCQSLNIPVVALNAGAEAAEELGLLHYVGQIEFNAGFGAGMHLIEAGMTEGYCLDHAPGNAVLVARCAGFETAIVASSGLTFSGVVDVPADNEALYVTTVINAVGEDRDWDGIGLYATGQVQAAPALQVKAQFPSVLVGASDVSDVHYAGFDAGTLLFGIDQNAYLQGYVPVPLLTYMAYTKQALGNRVIESGPKFVTASPTQEEILCNDNLFETCVTESTSAPVSSDDRADTGIIVAICVVGGVLILLLLYVIFRMNKLSTHLKELEKKARHNRAAGVL